MKKVEIELKHNVGDEVWLIRLLTKAVECPLCKGKGIVCQTFSNNVTYEIDCPECKGNKKTVVEKAFVAIQGVITKIKISCDVIDREISSPTFSVFYKVTISTGDSDFYYCDNEDLYGTKEEAENSIKNRIKELL